MKFCLLILLGLAAVEAVFCQSGVTVKSKKSGEPLEAATVYYKSLEGKMRDSSSAIVAGRNGFARNPYRQRTLFRVSFAGYKPYTDTLEAGGRKTALLEQAAYYLDEIVTTGQIIPQTSQKSVHKVKVISGARIESQAAANLRDLMMAETNVRISQDNILGSSISIHGISGENVKIMVDGIPVTGRLNGNIDLSQINLNNAEKVEVVEGPMSAIYGSDALGGVINIITKNPEGKGFSAEANGYYESVGTYNFDGIINYSSKNQSLAISGGRNFFSGFSLADTSRFKRWKPKEQYFADLNYIYHQEKFRLRYSGRYFDEFILNRGEPRPPYRETAFDDKYKTFRLINSLFAQSEIAERQYLSLAFSHSIYERKKNTYFKDLTTLDETLAADASLQDTSSFNSLLARGVYSYDRLLSGMALARALSFQAGYELNLDYAEGKRLEGLEFIGDYAAYATISWELFESLKIQPALRAIYNTKYPAPLIPSFNIKYDILPNFALRASYAKGFRAPSIKELFFLFTDVNHNIRGNDDLDAETSDSYNARLTYRIENLTNVIKLESGIFYNDIDGMITLANVEGDLYSYVNLGKYKTIGGEAQVGYYDANTTATASFSYIGRYNRLTKGLGAPDYNFAPEASLNVRYQIGEIADIAAYYKYTGEMPGYRVGAGEELIQYTLEDYHMLDVSVSKDLIGNKINLSIGFKNLFDVTNISYLDTGADITGSNIPVGWGRAFFTQLKINID